MQGQILGLITPAISMLIASAFVLLWLRDRNSRYILGLAIGFAMLATGFACFHYSPDPNGLFAVLAMHAAYSAGTIALCWAVCERAEAGIRLPVAIGIATLGAIALAATTFAVDHGPRLYAANSCYGLIFALAAQILARTGRRDAIDQLILWLFALTAAQFFIRPYFTVVMEQGMTAAEYRDSAFYSVAALSIAVLSAMLAMALIAACISDQINAIRAESRRDMLTGLLSRRAFEQEAVDLLDKAQENEVSVCAIVADIDHFKQVNDVWGHQAGDNAIACFGRILADMVRETDPVGRVGGEEFCVLVWSCDVDAAGRLAERIRERLASARIDGIQDDVHLTASFGVAQRRDGEGYGRLFARADSALYDAKEGGRDRVETCRVVAAEPGAEQLKLASA